MNKVAMITNIPSPYRVDLFYYIQTHIRDFEFHVIYTNKSEDNRRWNVQEEKLLNTHILESKILKIRNKLDTRYIHLPSDIGKVLSEIKPDAVIAFEYNPAALQGLAWCRLHGKKFIHLTDGTLHSERNISSVQKLTRRIICSNADACIASSTKAKEKLLAWGVKEEKIFISLLTVDISKYQNLERDPVPGRVLYVGSLILRKGLDLLIDALKYVEQDYVLHIVGNGTSEQIEQLRQKARKNEIEERIVFCGFLQGEELKEEYRTAQVFVLPTREDCFGLVLLEAMCAGVPIVCSKYADGAYDTVIEGKNGYIADPFSPIEFAQAINKAMENEAWMGSPEQQIKKFTFEQVSTAYTNAVEYVLRNN